MIGNACRKTMKAIEEMAGDFGVIIINNPKENGDVIQKGAVITIAKRVGYDSKTGLTVNYVSKFTVRNIVHKYNVCDTIFILIQDKKPGLLLQTVADMKITAKINSYKSEEVFIKTPTATSSYLGQLTVDNSLLVQPDSITILYKDGVAKSISDITGKSELTYGTLIVNVKDIDSLEPDNLNISLVVNIFSRFCKTSGYISKDIQASELDESIVNSIMDSFSELDFRYLQQAIA